MATMKSLLTRANAACEFCASKEKLEVYDVSAAPEDHDASLLTCNTCRAELAHLPDDGASLSENHWRSLNDTIWSPTSALQVQSWRLLDAMAPNHAWARDLLDMAYLEDDLLTWAKQGSTKGGSGDGSNHRDCNGATLTSGCSVTLIKDLNVKGAGFTAKRGTTVRNISLVADNDKQIEGRVSGQQIVILTEFVKKAS